MPITIIPTCETAVSAVPEWHRNAFKDQEDVLHSNQGWSPGALNLAQGVAIKIHAPLLHAEVTRLLIDLTRHPDDEERWSSQARTISPEQREKLEKRQKFPYLATLGERIHTALERGMQPVHLAFDTAELEPGLALTFEFDPRRDQEAEYVARWEEALLRRLPGLGIKHRSSPTRSLGGYLREHYPEVASIRVTAPTSSFLESDPIRWATLKKELIATIPRE